MTPGAGFGFVTRHKTKENEAKIMDNCSSNRITASPIAKVAEGYLYNVAYRRAKNCNFEIWGNLNYMILLSHAS
jgi:hypothetical protein